MAKISKGFSKTVAVLGILCLMWGICISIISGVLASKAPTYVYYNDGSTSRYYYINHYWWGGAVYLIPGVLGIATGCTRNVIVMVFFLIFDIFCLLASVSMTTLVGLLNFWWVKVNEQLEWCRTTSDFITSQCKCHDRPDKTWTVDGVSCEDLKGIEGMLVALIVLGALSALVSSIASYVSCCSLCNQEQDNPVTVVTQQPFYYAPPTMAVGHSYQQAGPQQYPPTNPYPPSYGAVPQYQYPTTNEKAKLVEN